MTSGCSGITVVIVLSMFSLVMSKPFLGDLLARAISSSSTPDDPQSHITDFRMMAKMDKKADKLQLIDAKQNRSSNIHPETSSEEDTQSIQISTEVPNAAFPASTLWQRWNRTDLLARIIDDILKPAHERITLVFQTLVPKDGVEDVLKAKQVSTDERLNSTKDDGSDELSADLEPLQHETEPALFDPPVNGSTLLGQFQARRNVIRRRVAKALSSITGLLILAANTRREGNARSTRSIKPAAEEHIFWTDEKHRLAAYSEPIETVLDDDTNETRPRRNAESVAIFLLEVFGSMAGFSWGIFKQVQSFFWYAVS
ncbi:uncharacterized protein LOC126558622 [Anopheles maculipalpis]|uniref:uncharacterized protein LOC126558622 n=1 Tax=Anopheles maculipalpis TaxID=1496333 RepID=UPI002158A2BD|nr:uncharacterized protein LOC126558622 [Anopheles maculipalpis]